MDSFACETGDCLGEIDLVPIAAVVFNGMRGKLFKTCLLWVFSPFWGACPDLRLQDLIEVPRSRSFN